MIGLCGPDQNIQSRLPLPASAAALRELPCIFLKIKKSFFLNVLDRRIRLYPFVKFALACKRKKLC